MDAIIIHRIYMEKFIQKNGLVVVKAIQGKQKIRLLNLKNLEMKYFHI